MPAVLNAANEIAVESFLKRRMPFTAIPVMIAHAMKTVRHEEMATLDDVLKTDTLARDAARVAQRHAGGVGGGGEGSVGGGGLGSVGGGGLGGSSQPSVQHAAFSWPPETRL